MIISKIFYSELLEIETLHYRFPLYFYKKEYLFSIKFYLIATINPHYALIQPFFRRNTVKEKAYN